MIKPSKKPKLLKENKNELVNGLLRCQSAVKFELIFWLEKLFGDRRCSR